MMAGITDRTSVAGEMDLRYVGLGIGFTIASVVVASSALLNNEISTAMIVLIYVLVGALLIGIGTSTPPDSDPE